jgi:hypothetical protein
MKKITTAVLALSLFLLTACGASASGNQPDSAAPATSTTESAPPPANPMNNDPRAISEQTRLIIGTLKLERTGSAVTPEQAARLLPLWKSMQQASQDGNTNQEIIDSLVEQIQEAMNAEQLQAITAMNLTQEDIRAALQEQGIPLTGPQPANGGPNPPQGTPPAGGGPGGNGGPGGPPGGGQAPGAEQMATAQAGRRPFGNGLGATPPGLIEAFIQFLEKRAGS